MPTRGVLSVVASAGGLTSADVADLTSKPSMAFFQISGFVLTSASGASPLVRLTFAPAFNRRFTSIAEVAPLYGNRHPFGPLALTDNIGFGVAATFSSVSVPGSGLLANSVFTPNCMPSDHAETSYGASAGAPGERRTSGYVCFSSRSFA